MSKKKLTFVFVTIIVILICIGIFLLFNKRESIYHISEQEQENYITAKDLPKEIQIYDIEDGYFTVPYNKHVKSHNYNWDNLYTKNNNHYIYEDDKYTTKLGVDVSTYQGEIDWVKVKNAGINFAILRLGFRGYGEKGNILLDDTFEENARQAVNANIDIGIYFFSQAISEEEAKEEANYVLEMIKDKVITYPIYFDLEKIKNNTARTDNLTVDDITKITIAFCKEIEKAGYIPGVYGNAKTLTTKMQLEKLNHYQIWYADYQEKPLYPYNFTIWQYTEKGNVSGINGNVDINLHFVSKY